jgi:hypothetical protein
VNLTTRAAALALGVERKVLDNILAREARAFVDAGSRGRSRRIDFEALERIAIALILGRDLGVPLTRGLELAEEIMRTPGNLELAIGTLTTLRFDTERLHRALEAATADALEEYVPPRRGRPPRP